MGVVMNLDNLKTQALRERIGRNGKKLSAGVAVCLLAVSDLLADWAGFVAYLLEMLE